MVRPRYLQQGPAQAPGHVDQIPLHFFRHALVMCVVEVLVNRNQEQLWSSCASYVLCVVVSPKTLLLLPSRSLYIFCFSVH